VNEFEDSHAEKAIEDPISEGQRLCACSDAALTPLRPPRCRFGEHRERWFYADGQTAGGSDVSEKVTCPRPDIEHLLSRPGIQQAKEQLGFLPLDQATNRGLEPRLVGLRHVFELLEVRD
jgi:hypothetical protein